MHRITLQLGSIGAVLLILTAAGVLLTLSHLDVGIAYTQIQGAVLLLVLAGVAYLAAVFAVLRPHQSSRRAVWIVLCVAIAMRLAFVFAPPMLSSDMYRYVWDGQVQKAGINPYRYVPADPALKPLRDEKIFPRINRADYAHTIYPPEP